MPSTLNSGIQPNQSLIQRDRLMTFHCSRKAPHNPYTTLGTAAIRSTTAMSARLMRAGAYSEM